MTYDSTSNNSPCLLVLQITGDASNCWNSKISRYVDDSEKVKIGINIFWNLKRVGEIIEMIPAFSRLREAGDEKAKTPVSNNYTGTKTNHVLPSYPSPVLSLLLLNFFIV